MAFLLRRTILSGPSGHFVMELPPYRFPTIRGVLVHMWERGRAFLIRAGTIIFGVVVLIWLLDYTDSLEPIGKAIAPIFAPCGFDQWQAAVGLIFGFLAKEVVVGTFGTLFTGVEELGGLGSVIGFELGWSSLIAYAFMAFCLIYVPCVASIAIIRRETNSWRWPGFAIGYTIALGWIVAMLIYQIGGLFIG
jgi:ferrous iron transport protein B